MDLNKLLKTDPNDVYLLGNRRTAYLHLGLYKELLVNLNKQLCQYEKSLKDLNRALEINPNTTKALVNHGITYIYLDRRRYNYQLLGQYEKSLADLNRALEIMPNDVIALCNQCTTY
ncbi:19688_t:CDS:2 [Cetraspora pellucida]|uniref:19688_t:CDS:1 n=1 Tax=Cetraspora pellucida TaxID=1433469 RepID=A0A9N9IJW5_9GLOM|nr:19688_t:CDS:2 [Cetraspora pellucida]